MELFVTWLVAKMLVWVPGYNSEATNDTKARYESFARDAVTVAFDPDEKPLFGGANARVKTAVTLLSIASFESGYRHSVDIGEERGDSGSSWCLMQVHLPGAVRVTLKGDVYGYAGYKSSDGWSGKDLVEDRKRCFRAALHIARESYRVCGNLSVYATGKCYREADPVSRLRTDRAKETLRGSFWVDGDISVRPSVTAEF